MATTEPRPRADKSTKSARERFSERLGLVFADRHPALLRYAARIARGDDRRAEDWVGTAHLKTLQQAHELFDLDEGLVMVRLRDHIRHAAGGVRRRAVSPAHSHPTVPQGLEGAVGDAPDPAERVETATCAVAALMPGTGLGRAALGPTAIPRADQSAGRRVTRSGSPVKSPVRFADLTTGTG